MSARNRTSWRLGVLACLGTLVAVAWSVLAVDSSRAADPPRLLIKYDANREFAVPKGLQLRPGVEQTVFLAVENPEKIKTKKPRDVVVQVWQNGKPVEGVSAALSVPPSERKDVVFAKPKDPMAKPMPPKPPDKPVLGPPYQFEIVLLEPADLKKPLQRIAFNGLMLPHKYLKVDSTFNSTKHILTVKVTALDNFFGPKCRLELELPPERMPAIQGKARDGQYANKVTAPNRSVKLVGKGLRFQFTGKDEGFIYVNVDGYKRAFVIKHDFRDKEGDDTGTLVQDPEVRLKAAPVGLSGEPFPVRLEIDYTPIQQGMPEPDEVRVEVGMFLDAKKTEEQFVNDPLTGVRKQQVLFTAEPPTGSLLFKTSAVDWTLADIETEKVFGDRYLQVRLLRKDEVIVWKKDGVDTPLVDSKTITFFAKDDPPAAVKFVPLPAGMAKKIFPGAKLDLLAQVNPKYRNFKVKQLYMVWEKLPKDGKFSPAAEADLVQGGTVEVPKDEKPSKNKEDKKFIRLLAKGSFGAGPEMTVTDKIGVIVVEPPKAATPRTKGDIKVILELESKERLPGTPVTLGLVVKGEKKLKPVMGKKPWVTDKDGVVVIKDLDPGEYKVSAVRNLVAWKGSADATVVADKEVEVKIVVKP